MADSSRVAKELRECEKDSELSGITAVSVGGALNHLTGGNHINSTVGSITCNN
jgi:hypothetical protein